jgi:adenylate kinase family enzyme
MIDAVLLIGPTGAGKSPLGEALERTGWIGRRCLHIDFGARLREAGSNTDIVPGLSVREREDIRAVLTGGGLLEDGQFEIARKILTDFLRRNNAKPGDLLILNGLPRHAGQARDLEATAEIRRVVVLEASPETIRRRIRTNAAGDRAERGDDSPAEVERKLALFKERTEPLIAFYAEKGVPVVCLDVGPETTAKELLGRLGQRFERETPK